jgi:hypothetical protein
MQGLPIPVDIPEKTKPRKRDVGGFLAARDSPGSTTSRPYTARSMEADEASSHILCICTISLLEVYMEKMWGLPD